MEHSQPTRCAKSTFTDCGKSSARRFWRGVAAEGKGGSLTDTESLPEHKKCIDVTAGHRSNHNGAKSMNWTSMCGRVFIKTSLDELIRLFSFAGMGPDPEMVA
ncbi:MAG: hypothetical protein EOQ63_28135 [Mesorhizobium sp.]|uniref:hypothetical protein n=1 Tax=Mesorhizobium sp. TaxID=1871066 RepID=UPI000FE94881|nr:hypothetical protein [Mesorhizobium sp.]RWG41479.1 MAG: hypothetical protein EOQ63_28135 [Mesorhizobium sp.]TIR04085.1 MAG: hypothetical protein E5X32_22725 [Mesorhizobium sp.]